MLFMVTSDKKLQEFSNLLSKLLNKFNGANVYFKSYDLSLNKSVTLISSPNWSSEL